MLVADRRQPEHEVGDIFLVAPWHAVRVLGENQGGQLDEAPVLVGAVGERDPVAQVSLDHAFSGEHQLPVPGLHGA